MYNYSKKRVGTFQPFFNPLEETVKHFKEFYLLSLFNTL